MMSTNKFACVSLSKYNKYCNKFDHDPSILEVKEEIVADLFGEEYRQSSTVTIYVTADDSNDVLWKM